MTKTYKGLPISPNPDWTMPYDRTDTSSTTSSVRIMHIPSEVEHLVEFVTNKHGETHLKHPDYIPPDYIPQ